MRITDTAAYFLTGTQGSVSQTHLRHPIPFLRGLTTLRTWSEQHSLILPTRSLPALMWDPRTHTDDNCFDKCCIHIYPVFNYFETWHLHHDAILPEKGKLLIAYIFAKAILKWWTFLFHFICWYLYAYVCGAQRTVSGVFLNSSPHWFSGRVSHWTWRLPIWTWPQCPQIPLLSTEITGMCYSQLWQGIWTQVLMLVWKVLLP